MKKTKYVFIPCTILLAINCIVYIVFDKLLLDKLATGENVDFRYDYGSVSVLFMFVSLAVIFFSITIFFEATLVKYIGVLLASIAYSFIGCVKMDEILYLIPLGIAVLTFVTYLIAKIWYDKPIVAKKSVMA